jgi:hypothetical protein
VWVSALPGVEEVAVRLTALQGLQTHTDPGPARRPLVGGMATRLLAQPAADLWRPAVCWAAWRWPAAAPLVGVALLALNERLLSLTGGTTWFVVGAVAVVPLVLVLVAAAPGRRRQQEEARRIQYALRHHVDPGAPLHQRADRQTRHFARFVWLGWSYPLLLLTHVRTADWDRPAVTVPAFAVVAALSLGLAGWRLGMSRSARRWVADPPGPPRELPAPARWGRWLGRRWLGSRRWGVSSWGSRSACRAACSTHARQDHGSGLRAGQGPSQFCSIMARSRAAAHSSRPIRSSPGSVRWSPVRCRRRCDSEAATPIHGVCSSAGYQAI